MPHISHKPTSQQMQHEMERQLLMLLRKNSFGREGLYDLLTETEQVMLAKRLMGIVLFLEDASIYKVMRILAVSPSTAARWQQNLLSGEYKALQKQFSKIQERKKFWQTLEKISRAGMPEMGKGRWKWLNEIYAKE